MSNSGARGKRRRRPKHLVALEQDYQRYLEINNGIERCAICNKPPGSRRLDRDHDHKTGEPRGLLCAQCNMRLKAVFTPEWLEAAAKYLRERSSGGFKPL